MPPSFNLCQFAWLCLPSIIFDSRFEAAAWEKNTIEKPWCSRNSIFMEQLDRVWSRHNHNSRRVCACVSQVTTHQSVASQRVHTPWFGGSGERDSIRKIGISLCFCWRSCLRCNYLLKGTDCYFISLLSLPHCSLSESDVTRVYCARNVRWARPGLIYVALDSIIFFFVLFSYWRHLKWKFQTQKEKRKITWIFLSSSSAAPSFRSLLILHLLLMQLAWHHQLEPKHNDCN